MALSRASYFALSSESGSESDEDEDESEDDSSEDSPTALGAWYMQQTKQMRAWFSMLTNVVGQKEKRRKGEKEKT